MLPIVGRLNMRIIYCTKEKFLVFHFNCNFMKEKLLKLVNWVITIATALAVMIDKIWPFGNPQV